MKKTITTFAVFAILAFTQFVKAQSTPINFYVTSGQEFTLTPQGNNSTSKLFWRIDGALTEILGSVAGGELKTTFTNTTTDIATHTIRLSIVADLLNGCESDPIEYQIIVLPKLTVSLETPTKTNFCVGADIDVELKASITSVSNLLAYGIELPFEWTDPDGEILTETGTTIRATKAGLYKVVAKYKFPVTGLLVPTATKLATDLITGTSQEILKNLPIPTVPAITLF